MTQIGPSQTQFVHIGPARVAYTDLGTGPGVVLVHGAGANKDINWGPLSERLKGQRRVVALDLSGSGETTDDGGPLTVEQLADQVAGVADAAGLDIFQLVGYSMGSVVAAVVAARQPERVRSLSLVATWARSNARIRFMIGLRDRLYHSDREAWARLTVLLGTGPETFALMDDTSLDGLIQMMVAGTTQPGADGLLAQQAMVVRTDIHDLLPTITAPTQVIGFTRDQMIVVENAREVHHLIPGAQYAELDAGHLAPFQHPDAFARLVGDFVLGQA